MTSLYERYMIYDYYYIFYFVFAPKEISREITVLRVDGNDTAVPYRLPLGSVRLLMLLFLSKYFSKFYRDIHRLLVCYFRNTEAVT